MLLFAIRFIPTDIIGTNRDQKLSWSDASCIYDIDLRRSDGDYLCWACLVIGNPRIELVLSSGRLRKPPTRKLSST